MVRAKKGEPVAFLLAALRFSGDDCVAWPFNRNQKGYGQVVIEGRPYRASRILCGWAHGGAPDASYQAAHHCGNPSCVNPSHLRWASQSENEKDKIRHGTFATGSRVNGAKITDDLARAIIADRRSSRAIAAEIGCSEVTVWKVRTGRAWRAATGLLEHKKPATGLG